ncbi:ankyrin repeat domain-containing protein [bacterium]|nr:ankyrin repeat domain-containing protein [bacterium]
MNKLIFKIVFIGFALNATTIMGQNIFTAVQTGEIRTVARLLEYTPALIDTQDGAGRQPLHFAANGGDTAMVSLLLQRGADPGASSLAGTTVLHFAAAGGHTEVVRMLLTRHIPIDVRNNQQVTPLYFSAMRGHDETAELLLSAGADPDAFDAEHGTPIQAAAQAGHAAMVRLLFAHGAALDHRDDNGRTAIHFACQSGSRELVDFLMKQGLDITAPDRFGISGPVSAIQAGHPDLALALIADYPQILKSRSADGSTLLHAAALAGSGGLIEAVLGEGADINHVNVFGLSPLDYAIQGGDSVTISRIRNEGGISFADTESGPATEYPDGELPNDEPRLFAPGLISTPFFNERDVCFTRDMRELYVTRWQARDWDILVLRRPDRSWLPPEPVSFNSPWLEAEAFLTPDETSIYFLSNRPKSGAGQADPWEIWVTHRNGDEWSAPGLLGDAFTGGFYTTFTAGGTMHLTLDGKMQYALPEGKGFGNPVPLPESVNGDHGGYNGFVAPDESYLIFSTTIEGEGYGDGDLYITFRNEDGLWTKARNMGPTVNSFSRDYCPSVSPDGTYFFFSSRRLGTEDIFWMDAEIIDTLRSTGMK